MASRFGFVHRIHAGRFVDPVPRFVNPWNGSMRCGNLDYNGRWRMQDKKSRVLHFEGSSVGTEEIAEWLFHRRFTYETKVLETAWSMPRAMASAVAI
jgi:hypothetical protein